MNNSDNNAGDNNNRRVNRFIFISIDRPTVDILDGQYRHSEQYNTFY